MVKRRLRKKTLNYLGIAKMREMASKKTEFRKVIRPGKRRFHQTQQREGSKT